MVEFKQHHLGLNRQTSSVEDKTRYLDLPFSPLQNIRHKFVPVTPDCIKDVANQKLCYMKQSLKIDEGLKDMFPTLLAGGAEGMQYLELKVDNEGETFTSPTPLRIGCVLSGGQAAGGHNVIMGLYDMVKTIHPDSKLFGFLAGPHGIFTNNYMDIQEEYMGRFRNMGGFDMIRSGRHKIETPEQFAASLKNATDLDLDGLIVIGGDDSNTNACLLAEYFAKHNAKCKVIGAPKTIDGDLRNEHIQVSFGFDTATKVYSEAIGNLCSDVLSGKDFYHFVRVMGRSASHIALECALQTRINCVLIGEEVAEKNQTLVEITNYVADIICKRTEIGKNYGVILVPEGLIEFIPEMGSLIGEINEILSEEFEGDMKTHLMAKLTETSKALFNFLPDSISSQLLLDRDPHGNVQVAKIDTEKLLILLLNKELKARESKDLTCFSNFHPKSHYFGYEGRCAIPSNFDSQYCYCIGLNGALLIKSGASGYMSCVKNLNDKDPRRWVIAGTPLPTMMGVERRKGKNVPVITKALVELDGAMFKAYQAVREKWGYLDCYVSPGPIQFAGPASDALNFMVSPPDIEQLVKETERAEHIETVIQKKDSLYRDPSLLSELSLARIEDYATIPSFLESNATMVTATKKYSAANPLSKAKIAEQYPRLRQTAEAEYFVECQDRVKQSRHKGTDFALNNFNDKLASVDQSTEQRIGVVFMGRTAPGGQNVIDGLLRFKAQRSSVKLFGFLNGVNGIMDKKYAEFTAEQFTGYRNLGGYDFLGRGVDSLRSDEQKEAAAAICSELKLTGLVLVGATHTMTDAVSLSNHFLIHGVDTRVVAVPATIDGNICHTYLQSAIGFDTAAKMYSQLIGNMLTDSASAVKYWYFMRLMGQQPSHLALECALKTSPNIVIISEESNARHETLQKIVSNLCDVIVKRAEDNKNYGCIIIPEGLLLNIPTVNNLIQELNDLFDGCKNSEEFRQLKEKLLDGEEIKQLLSEWSYALFRVFPEFIKTQMLVSREMSGKINIASVETEKMLAYFCDIELQARKAAGAYKGGFSPVTHFFGYQGRSAHPSRFDCSLGSTAGFTAGVLIEAGLTSVAVSVKELTEDPSKWRVGGVPLLALLQSQPSYKEEDLIVPSENVSLDSRAYQVLKSHMHKWKLSDHYTNPGPNQFYLDELKPEKVLSETIKLRFSRQDDLMSQIRGLCNSIQNDALYSEHEHLLFAALSSLKSAKNVINSMSNTRDEELNF